MDIVAGEKTREGRPFYGQYTEVQVGQYRNFGCPFYWVVVRIASIDVFTNLTEMVNKCGWRSLMPRCSSPQKCISAYLKFKGMDIYKHSKWVAFTVEVLEYKLHKAPQFALCACGCAFTPPLALNARLTSPQRLLCELCQNKFK